MVYICQSLPAFLTTGDRRSDRRSARPADVARVISASATDDTVELSVTDTGHGLSDEQQGRLFAEFAQTDSATAQLFGRSGLGLVICRRLAVLMDGGVTRESGVDNPADRLVAGC